MAQPLFRPSLLTRSVAVALVAALVWFGCGQDRAPPTAPGGVPPTFSLQGQQQGLDQAIAAQERHTDRLLAIRGVVGTAVGFTAGGQPAVKIFTARSGVAGLPRTLDGVAVEVEVTGEILALRRRFPRPVPIGVSTGNVGQCSAGTIGARVKDATNVYALSNNHVYALENNAPIGSEVLQPGRFDTNCAVDPNDVIGTLAAFEPIVFSASANNTIDAAIAVSSTANLGNATPSNGYGTPQSLTLGAFVGQLVQKYGRTSGLTRAQVTAINAIVHVSYSSGLARFVDQIIVQSSRKPFIKAGDSGSLLVTDPGANPVGLLYAGTSDGRFAVANEIDRVLGRFGVSVDGQ